MELQHTQTAFTRVRKDPDIRMSQLRIDLPTTRKRLKCTLYISGAIRYAIRVWSNTLRYQELFENDFKGGSSGCPGALRTLINGASGYSDVTEHALCGFLRLESGFFSFRKLQNFSNALLLSCNSTIWFKVAIWASRGQKSISLGLKQKWHQTIPCEAHCLSWKFETIWASGFGVMSAFLRAKLKPWCGHLPAHCQKVIDPFPELPRPHSLQGLVRFSRNFLLLIHKI